MENAKPTGGSKNLKQAYRTAYLIAGFLKNTLSEEEKDELDDWILANEENMILFEKMTDEKNLHKANEWFREMDVESDLKKIKGGFISKRRFFPYSVAAAIVVVIFLGLYFFKTIDRKDNKSTIANKNQDIMSGSSKATLTLENGQVVQLGSEGLDTAIGLMAKALRNKGELVYETDNADSEEVYHTLSIPRKGQYKLVLPDGSQVWLNSESSIRYPVAFTGVERKVYLTGEAYFEVSKDKEKPFRVVASDVIVEALGTAFNINAYTNEPHYSTTLIEGSIMVTKGPNENILKPGQQVQITESDFDIVQADLDESTAWKDGKFKFGNTSLKEIMRQIERWYDAEVIYQDDIDLHLNITISRNEPVSKLLSIFEETRQVHFKIEGQKIIVMK